MSDRNHRGTVALAVAAFGIWSGATAQERGPGGFDGRLFQGLQWRSLGPIRGGRSLTAAGSARRPLEYYFGATGGGIWKTTDGGLSWRPVADRYLKSSSVGAVAVCEANPDVVYAGMGETELRGNVIQGDGVYRTEDGGNTWTHLGLAETQAIGKIRIHPTDCNLAYVAALGHVYGPNADRGIFRTRDGGKSWEKILFRDERTGGIDLALDPADPQVLYAGLWEVNRKPWGLFSGGPGSGLFKSTDGGDRWTEITRNPGLPRGMIAKIGVAVSGADSRRLYAIVEADSGGIFRSDDAGATWQLINDDLNLWERGYYYNRIFADPKDRDRVYIPNIELTRSLDGGKTFKSIRTPHSDSHDLWIAPDDPARMIEANDGGATVTTNGGQTWTSLAFPTAQLYHVITTRDTPYHVCGSQQDNRSVCVSSTPNPTLVVPPYPVAGGETGYIATRPDNPNIFYAGNYDGYLTRFDRATGQARNIQPWPEKTMGHAMTELTERFAWTSPIVLSPVDPRVLYTASQRLWRTTNEGHGWEAISPDLTRHDPKTLAPAPPPILQDRTGSDTYGTIFAVAPSRREVGTIWVGSDDGLVHLTRDGGRTWRNVTPPGLAEWSRVSLIEASPHRAGSAYLAVNRFQIDDRKPYLFRTDDFGKTWISIVDGIAPGDFVRAVREDPKRPRMLYAGTEHGVYVSFNDGGSWQSLSLNLPVTQVPDLQVEENDLVIATHGRSFYVLDGIGPLRQLSAEVANAKTHLFQPISPRRVVDGAVALDFVVRAPPASWSLEIFDSAGAAVRTIGRDSLKAGHNRFVWNLRYPGFETFPGIIVWDMPTEGPVALPGRYQARLTVDGVSAVRSFEVKADPRLRGSTMAALRRSFQLSIRIRDRASEAAQSVVAIRAARRAIQDRVGRTGSDPLRAAGRTLLDSLAKIEAEVYEVDNRTVEDAKNHPLKLFNKIGYLSKVVQSAEAPPTDQTLAVYALLSGRLDQQLRALDDLLGPQLTRFNEQLRGDGLEPIAAPARWRPDSRPSRPTRPGLLRP